MRTLAQRQPNDRPRPRRPSLAAFWPVFVPLLSLPALWPLFQLGLPNGDDNILHFMKVVALDQQWRSGVVYSRWVPEFTLGLGYPLFNYYGLAPFYVAELLHVLGASVAAALAVEYAILVLAAGLGMWCLAFDIFGGLPAARRPWAALISAVAFVYAPYLLTNLYVRGAIGELAGQALLPWLLWGLRRIFNTERPRDWAVLTGLGLAVLAVTHSLMLLFSVPVLLGYAAWLAWKRRPALQRLGWAAAAMLLAAGLSAFYWLPLIAEREYVSPATFDRVVELMAGSALSWRTLLDGDILFHYTALPPFQLGLIQVALGVAGWWLGRRSLAEWGFWAMLGLAAVWATTEWAVPLWTSSPALASISFSWRLLSMTALPLALAAGGLVAASPPGRWVNLLGALVIVLIIAANAPRMPWLQPLPDSSDSAGLAQLAQFELTTREYGATNNPGGNTPDFLPRWADPQAIRDWRPAPPDQETVTGRGVSLAAASAYELRGTLTGDLAGRLRFASFYFPGWRFYLDDAPLPTYATTSLGLLTVDVPAGNHRFRLVWQGTEAQVWATDLSLASLLALGVWLWLGLSRRITGGLALVAFALAGVAALRPLPAPTPLQAPPSPAASSAVELLGLRTQLASDGSVYLFPLWLVRQASAGWQAHWHLLDSQGRAVAETNAGPWFDTANSVQWPVGTLVDDAYRLALPAGLPAGSYSLAFCLHPLATDEIDCRPEQTYLASKLQWPGSTAAPPPASAHQALEASFGSVVRLAGYRLKQNGGWVIPSQRYVPAQPGDVLEYALDWQALRPLTQDYHGFINLLDEAGQPLVQQDYPLGTEFFPPRLWDVFYPQHQNVQISVPAIPAGAVYWTTVGVYDQRAQRLPVQSAGTTGDLAGAARLAALKVIPQTVLRPEHALTAQFGDIAHLLGYDVSLPAAGLRAGGALTLTLYYQTDQGTASDLTQFVHVFDAGLGLAGQSDAPPRQGLNPTSAWLPGEVVANVVVVPITAGAVPGHYQVLVGFYDPATGGQRLPGFNGNGEPLRDGELAVMGVTVEP